MTPTTLFSMALSRSGEHAPSSTQIDRARQYFNLIQHEIEGLSVDGGRGNMVPVDWRFLYKISTLTTLASRSHTLADTNILYLIEYWDTSDNRTMTFQNPEDIIRANPDETFTGTPMVIAVTGRVAASGLWQIDIFPTPSAGKSIKYRYKSFVTDVASADDSIDLEARWPTWIQNALLWGTSALYMEQKENSRARAEWDKYSAALKFAIGVNKRWSVSPLVMAERTDRIVESGIKPFIIVAKV